MSVSLAQAKQALSNGGFESLAELASDPDMSDEALVFSFFFVPKSVESNPSWILVKLSGNVGAIASQVFEREDVANYNALNPSRDSEAMHLIVQLVSEVGVNQFKDKSLAMLYTLAHKNDELDEMLDDVMPEGGKAGEMIMVDPSYMRAVKWNRKADSPKVDKLVNDTTLSMLKLLTLYVAFPERAVKNPGWNILKNMTPEDIASLVANKDIYFDSVDNNRPFSKAADWLDYANFLIPVTDAIMSDPRGDGGDHDLGYPIYYRLEASIKADPVEFSEENILPNLSDKKYTTHIKRIFDSVKEES